MTFAIAWFDMNLGQIVAHASCLPPEVQAEQKLFSTGFSTAALGQKICLPASEQKQLSGEHG